MGIKKLTDFIQKQSQKSKIPELVKMNDNRLKMIFNHQKGKEIRNIIIQIYEKQQLDVKIF